MRKVHIVPVEGRVILMPERNFKPVPAEGTAVMLNSYYQRAITDGDLAIVERTSTPPAPVVEQPPVEAPVEAPVDVNSSKSKSK